MYGTTQPPNLKPRVGSSFGPPGACITPSNDTNAPVTTLLMSVLRFGKALARALASAGPSPGKVRGRLALERRSAVGSRAAAFAVSRTSEPERFRQPSLQ